MRTSQFEFPQSSATRTIELLSSCGRNILVSFHLQFIIIYCVDHCCSEILHRLRHRREAPGEVHAPRQDECEVQDMEGGREYAIRIPHHDAHRLQHTATHDEGEASDEQLAQYYE